MSKKTKKVLKTTKKSAKTENIEQAKELLAKNGIVFAGSGEVVVDQAIQDFRSALLVVSIAVNIAILFIWVILQLTTKYDSALVSALLQR